MQWAPWHLQYNDREIDKGKGTRCLMRVYDNDDNNDNENNFIVMKLHFHSLYKSNNIPNEDYFSLAKKTCIMYNAQENGYNPSWKWGHEAVAYGP